jgi:hypothetical protein
LPIGNWLPIGQKPIGLQSADWQLVPIGVQLADWIGLAIGRTSQIFLDWIGNWLADQKLFVQLGHPDERSFTSTEKIHNFFMIKRATGHLKQAPYLAHLGGDGEIVSLAG